MFRIGMVFAAAVAFAAPAPRASAQPFPASPRVGPGTSYPSPAIAKRPGTGKYAYFPVVLPSGWGLGWGYQTYNPWVGYGYSYGGIVPPDYAPQPAPEQPRPDDQPPVLLAGEFPGTLSVQFPAAAEVWLDGKKAPGSSAGWTLTSPALKPDQKYTFLVKGRWAAGGKTYESSRSVTVGSADRSRLMVVSGDPVNE
jgi:uncharacterized protein (TIGR03000 family)